MKSILAAVDLSEMTQPVLEKVSELAQATGARVWVVHVAAPDPDFVDYSAGPPGVRDQVAAHLRDEHRQLQELAQELRDSGVDATALLMQGPAIEKLIEETRKIEADLIVVGSHGHGAIYRILLGSVSEGILRRTRIPLLIVPAPGREEEADS